MSPCRKTKVLHCRGCGAPLVSPRVFCNPGCQRRAELNRWDRRQRASGRPDSAELAKRYERQSNHLRGKIKKEERWRKALTRQLEVGDERLAALRAALKSIKEPRHR